MTFGYNVFNCECGGLRHICPKYGHLPASIGHYRKMGHGASQGGYEVVWSGTLQRSGQTSVNLLPDRAERPDGRLATMPNYDLDDGEAKDARPRRHYNRTGRHVGKCSRTDPSAPQYLPRRRVEAAVATEEPHG